ncbi:MAG TPA: phosphoribosylaminoimidazolesuccinocarboxamide synthase [Planctomycetota bacterium]|nr:phosphoribosylaminoimidazolesuccinocarboxamide synthase [Planctomycetota bacterium]
MSSQALLQTDLPGVNLLNRGKVRDIYDLGDSLLIVATDRISAFDFILASGIPDKGRVLTQMSKFWFGFTAGITKNHLITTDVQKMGHGLEQYADQLDGRSMLVKKTKVLPVECVVRGYLAGSGWKDYQAGGSLSGIKLPPGLKQADRLPEPIFTPSTKAESGHDEAITQAEVEKIVGKPAADYIRAKSIHVYTAAARYALSRGIIIADTKFEWGKDGSDIILIDEVLTPDSSRFWDLDGYQPGTSPMSFDKQFVRDWLESSGWNKQPPAPALPPDIIEKTRAKYLEALKRLTG